MQHDLHHRELVEIGVEQGLDDHREPAQPRDAGGECRIECRRCYLLVGERATVAARGGAGDPASLSCGHASLFRRPMLISCVAYQNGRKVADIPIDDISEYVRRPDCFVWVALLDPTTRGAGRDGGRVQPASRSPSTTPAKGISGPRSKSMATRCCLLHPVESVKAADNTEELASRRSDVFIGENYVLSVRHRTQSGLSRPCARAPSASPIS